MQRACKLLFLACLALQLSAGVPLAADQPTNSPASTTNQTAKADTFVQPKTFAELLALPPDQLEKVDIARIDLLCAEGLPGAEDLDVGKCIQTLDEWARFVKTETDIWAVGVGTTDDDARAIQRLNQEMQDQEGYYSFLGGRECHKQSWDWFHDYTWGGRDVPTSQMQGLKPLLINGQLLTPPNKFTSTPAFLMPQLPSFGAMQVK